MSKINLSKIEKVNLREIFSTERKFSSWLKKNIKQLSDVIGVEIGDLKTEDRIGDFSADLVGVEANSEDQIIIENQFNQTDHDHLGKIITYASGKDAKYIIWIAEKIREEHQKALEWLNEGSSEDTSFFGLEINIIKIGNSDPAMDLKLIISPNAWGREIKHRTISQKVDARRQAYMRFFTRLVAEYEKAKSDWGHLSPKYAAWLAFGAGRTGFRFVWAFRGNNRFSTELFIDTGNKEENKNYFNELKNYQEKINEVILGLKWEELPDKKGSRIVVYYQMPASVKKLNDEQIDKLINWCIEQMDLFKKTFPKYIRKISN
ncbi:DUF4268 domain-containing protein [Candidatus Parcubacteria bacterium]|nr:DUF4268 domain-containing protein [Candidatus Parcubacteria bacterium]